MKRTTTFALLASALMLFSVAAPAGASGGGSLTVSVTQDDGGDATVTVTTTGDNASVPVENASVTVESTDENTTYGGSGTYATDANGTASLPAPGETVNVSVAATYDNESASTTATLVADGNVTDGNETDENATDGNETAFGQQVSAFVYQLQESNDTSDVPLGLRIAAFVLANNPGNAPDHAGPPGWLLDDSVNETAGPPAHAGASENGSAGPPAHAGPPDNESVGPSENESAGPPDNRSGGPPDDAGKDGNGPPDDRGNGKDKGGGPPDDRGNDGNRGGGPPGDKGKG